MRTTSAVQVARPHRVWPCASPLWEKRRLDWRPVRWNPWTAKITCDSFPMDALIIVYIYIYTDNITKFCAWGIFVCINISTKTHTHVDIYIYTRLYHWFSILYRIISNYIYARLCARVCVCVLQYEIVKQHVKQCAWFCHLWSTLEPRTSSNTEFVAFVARAIDGGIPEKSPLSNHTEAYPKYKRPFLLLNLLLVG